MLQIKPHPSPFCFFGLFSFSLFFKNFISKFKNKEQKMFILLPEITQGHHDLKEVSMETLLSAANKTT
jgi:hypothetical protein